MWSLQKLLHALPGWQRELHFSFFLRQLHRPELHWVLHWHFTNPCPPVAFAVAVLNARQTSGTSSALIKACSIVCRSAAVYFDTRTPSRQPTVYSPSFSTFKTTTKRFFGSLGPRSTSGTLNVAHCPTNNDLVVFLPRRAIRNAAFTVNPTNYREVLL